MPAPVLEWERHRIDLDRYRCGWHPLGKLECRLLQCLFDNFGQTMTHERLTDAQYHDDIDGGPLGARMANVERVKMLRRKLESTAFRIVSVYGVGYYIDWRIKAELRNGVDQRQRLHPAQPA